MTFGCGLCFVFKTCSYVPCSVLVVHSICQNYFTRGEPSVSHPSGAALLREKYSGDSEETLEGQEARSEEEVFVEAENMSEQGGRSSWCD